MASQYQHRQFFRRVPNALLAQYFERKAVDLGVDFGTLSETGVDPVFEAFTALAEHEQAVMEADFLDINALACDGGIAALLNEAAFYRDETFVGAIEAVDGYHGKSMWAFLNRPEYWRGAASLLHADNISVSFWNKRNGLPPVPPNVEHEDIERLERAISHYFNKTEGRGRNCKVEPYRKVKTGKEYFFAYPEDYGQSGVEWERSRLTTRSRHPAFEIIFVYCEAEGSLDIYAPKNTKAVAELRRIFARTILKLNALPDGRIDNRVYDLDLLADPSFEFQFPVGSGIRDAVVTRLRLTLRYAREQRLVLEANTQRNRKAVYDLLAQLNPPPYFVNQASIKVMFHPEPGKRSSSKTFAISYPNSCNLNHDGKDDLIRNMLAASGIEPRVPSGDGDGDA